jgi:hypothetical protein
VSTPQETALSQETDFQRIDSSASPVQQAATNLDNPPWGLLPALLTWIASVALLFLPQFLALPYVAAHYHGTQPTPEVLLADKTLVVILVSGILPAHLITLFVAWCVVTRFGKISAIKVLGLDSNGRMAVWQSVALALLLFGFAWIFTLAFG